MFIGSVSGIGAVDHEMARSGRARACAAGIDNFGPQALAWKLGDAVFPLPIDISNDRSIDAVVYASSDLPGGLGGAPIQWGRYAPAGQCHHRS